MLATSSWVWGWNFLVAVGTLGLAGGTGWLASTTRSAVRKSAEAIQLQGREVKLVEQQVKVSAEALASGARPVLVGAIAKGELTIVRGVGRMPTGEVEPILFPDNHLVAAPPLAVHYEEDGDMLYLSFCVRNVGAGVAFLQRAALLTRTPYPVRISPPIIGPGETARILIALTLKQSNGQFTDVNEVTRTGRGFVKATVGLFYTGASVGIALTTEIELSELIDSQGWLITGTTIWDGDTEADLGAPVDCPILASTDNIG
jgi:hypothetical protein